jgi:hypothetical protein
MEHTNYATPQYGVYSSLLPLPPAYASNELKSYSLLQLRKRRTHTRKIPTEITERR